MSKTLLALYSILFALMLLIPVVGIAQLDIDALPQDVKQALLNGRELITLIEEAMYDTKAELTQDTLKQVVSLDVSKIPDFDFSIIKSLPNLTTLTITQYGLDTLDELPPIKKLKILDISGNPLSSVDGIANKYPALVRLSIAGCPVSDLSPLGKCKKLENLYLSSAQYPSQITASEISSKTIKKLFLENAPDLLPKLGKLPKLNYLDVSDCKLTDVSVIQDYLSKLTVLDISNNPLTDLRFLKSMKKLSTLSLNKIPSLDLSMLKLCPKLTKLRMRSCGLSDASDLASICALKKLELLDVSDNQIRDFSFVKELNKLQSLFASGNPYIPSGDDYPNAAVEEAVNSQYSAKDNVFATQQLTHITLSDLDLGDLSFLRFFPNISRLRIDNCTYTSCEGIAQLKNLDSLTVKSASKLDLGTLSDLTKLTTISTYETPIKGELADLSKLKELNSLDLSGSDISDLSTITNFKVLQSLDLRNTKINDISALSKLRKLESLYISNTQVTDLTPLKKLTNLTLLSIDGLAVTDFTPIKALKKLTILSINCEGFTDATMLEGLNKLGSVSMSYVTQTTSQLEKLLPRNCAIQSHTVGDEAVWSIAATVEQRILQSGGIPADGLTQAERESLTSLNLTNSSNRPLMTDLSFLAKLPNLDYVSVDLGPTVDLTTLGELKRLRSIALYNPTDEQLKQIKSCDTIQYITIYTVTTIDLSLLRNLKKCDQLILYIQKQPVSLESLIKWPNLRALTIKYNDLQALDLSPLNRCKRLEDLSLTGGIVTDLTSISQLNNLKGSLYIELFAAQDLTPLDNLTLNSLNANVQTQDEADKLNALTQKAEQRKTIINAHVEPSLFQNATQDFQPMTKEQYEQEQIETVLAASDQELAQMTTLSLNLSISQNATLDIVQKMPNLQTLQLSSDEPIDASALAGLTQLKELSLYCDASDYQFLHSLPTLTKLRLSNNDGDDVSAVLGLKSLVELRLSSEPNYSLAQLCELETLEVLDLSNLPPDEDYTALAKLHNLTTLSIPVCNADQLKQIAGNTGLTQLTLKAISYTDKALRMSDILPLRALNQLTSLNLQYFTNVDATALESMTNLRFLCCSNTDFINTEALTLLPSLRNLFMYKCTLSDYAPLAELITLESLEITRNPDLSEQQADAIKEALPRTDIDIVLFRLSAEDYSNIEECISINGRLPEGLYSDEELQALTELNIHPYSDGLPLSDLAFLKKTPHLTALGLTSPIKLDYTQIGSLSDLETLSVWGEDDGVPCDDYSFLSRLPKLRTLYLDVNETGNLSAIKTLKNLEDLMLIRMNDTITLQDLAALPKLNSLFLPLPKDTDYETFEKFAELSTLDVPVYNEKNIDALAKLKRLINLSIQLADSQIDLSALSSLQSLDSFEITGWQATDLNIMTSFPKLSYIRLTDCQISDLSALTQIPNLKTLILSGTEADVEILNTLTGLDFLWIRQSKSLTQEQHDELVKALPNTEIKTPFTPD